MFGRLLGVALGACLFVTVSAAPADLYWCDGCTPEQERAMLAGIDHPAQWAEVYVGDLSTRSLRKYGVARSWGQAEPYDVRRRRTDPVIESAFMQLVHFHDTVPTGWKKAYALRIVDPAGAAPDYFDRALPVLDYPMPKITVQEVLSDPQQRRFLESYLQSDMLRRIPVDIGFTRRSVGFLQSSDQARSPIIQVLVHFADGSRITSVLDVATSPMVKLDEQSARDMHDRAVSSVQASGGAGDDLPDPARAASSRLTTIGSWAGNGSSPHSAARALRASCAGPVLRAASSRHRALGMFPW